MEIPDQELKQLLTDVKNLKEGLEVAQATNKELAGLLKDSAGPKVLRSITDRKVTVRVVNGKAVIGYKNRGVEGRPTYVYEKVDPNDKNNRILYVDLILEGDEEGKNPVAVQYNEFLREAERVECIVKETNSKEWTITQGYVKKREYEEYSMVELPVDVPVDIVGRTSTFTLEVGGDNPRELVISEQYVNI